jgi:hypothetical protein
MMIIGLTTLQRRGGLTVPQIVRDTLQWDDGRPVVVIQEDAYTWTSWIVPDAHTLFQHYQDQAPAAQPIPSITDTGRILPPGALWIAQMQPESPWRSVWQDLSTGQRQRRCDPLVLTEWTTAITTWLPTLSRQEQARYLQSVIAWPGLLLPERLRWLTALAHWGRQTTMTWLDAVWAQEQDADPLISPTASAHDPTPDA